MLKQLVQTAHRETYPTYQALEKCGSPCPINHNSSKCFWRLTTSPGKFLMAPAMWVPDRSTGLLQIHLCIHAHANVAAYPSDRILAKVRDLFRLRASGTFQQPKANTARLYINFPATGAMYSSCAQAVR